MLSPRLLKLRALKTINCHLSQNKQSSINQSTSLTNKKSLIKKGTISGQSKNATRFSRIIQSLKRINLERCIDLARFFWCKIKYKTPDRSLSISSSSTRNLEAVMCSKT